VDDDTNTDEHNMTWENGTQTKIVAVGSQVHITDIGERLTTGHIVDVRSVSETLDLADEHDEHARQLRLAARRAWNNEQSKKG